MAGTIAVAPQEQRVSSHSNVECGYEKQLRHELWNKLDINELMADTHPSHRGTTTNERTQGEGAVRVCTTQQAAADYGDSFSLTGFSRFFFCKLQTKANTESNFPSLPLPSPLPANSIVELSLPLTAVPSSIDNQHSVTSRSSYLRSEWTAVWLTCRPSSATAMSSPSDRTDSVMSHTRDN